MPSLQADPLAKKAKEKEGASAHLADVKPDLAASTSTTSTEGASSNIADIGDFAYTHGASALVGVGAKDKKIVGAVILDCGASACFTGDASILRNVKAIKPMEIDGIVPGARASKVGTLDLRTIDGKIVTLGTVFFVESLSYTLISTAVLTKTFNVEIKITKTGATIKTVGLRASTLSPSSSALSSLFLFALSNFLKKSVRFRPRLPSILLTFRPTTSPIALPAQQRLYRTLLPLWDSEEEFWAGSPYRTWAELSPRRGRSPGSPSDSFLIEYIAR